MLEILQSVRPLEKNDLVQKSVVGRTSLALVVIQFDNLYIPERHTTKPWVHCLECVVELVLKKYSAQWADQV